MKEARMQETVEAQSPPKISRGSLAKVAMKVKIKAGWRL